jgi:hypothetical protein
MVAAATERVVCAYLIDRRRQVRIGKEPPSSRRLPHPSPHCRPFAAVCGFDDRYPRIAARRGSRDRHTVGGAAVVDKDELSTPTSVRQPRRERDRLCSRCTPTR